MMFDYGVIGLKNFENIGHFLVGKKLQIIQAEIGGKPERPWSKEDLSKILILAIFCLSETMERLKVLRPTSVPKFNPNLCLSISAKNSPILCQLILIFEVSAHRPISLAETSPKKRRQRRTAIPADDSGNPLADQTLLAREKKIVQ